MPASGLKGQIKRFPIGFQPTLQCVCVHLKDCFLAIIGSFLVAGAEEGTAESFMSANSS